MNKKLVKPLRRPPYYYGYGLLYITPGGGQRYGPNSDLRGVDCGLWGYCTGLSGDCSGIWGDCTGLTGNCSGFTGDCTALRGNLDLIPMAERKKHSDLAFWVGGEEIDHKGGGLK